MKKIFLFLENSFLAVYENQLCSVLCCNNWKCLQRKCNFNLYELGSLLIVSYFVFFWVGVGISPEWLQNVLHFTSRNPVEKYPKSLPFYKIHLWVYFWHVCVHILLTAVESDDGDILPTLRLHGLNVVVLNEAEDQSVGPASVDWVCSTPRRKRAI
jgi:hypothetical protein